MSSKRHTPEGIVGKLRQVDVLTSQGSTVADAIRQNCTWPRQNVTAPASRCRPTQSEWAGSGLNALGQCDQITSGCHLHARYC